MIAAPKADKFNFFKFIPQSSEPIQNYHHGRQNREPDAMQQYYNNRQASVEIDYILILNVHQVV